MQHCDEIDQEVVTDTRESAVATENREPARGAQVESPVAPEPERRLGRAPLAGVIIAALVLGVLIVMGVRSRVHAEETLKSDSQRNAVLSVAVTRPTQGAGPLEITLPANTQAYIDTPIYARTNGYLRKWYADIGTRVHRGQILADIETPELDQQVQQAKSDLATAQANQQIAQITAERWKKLLAKNAVSRQEADQATSDFSARQSALSSAQANLRRLEQMQDFEKIYAPFDGVITARNVDIGALIQAGDNGSLRSELFHMASTDKLRLFVPVPEVYADTVHTGDKIVVTSDAASNQKFVGTIVRNSESIDISNRTLNMEVDVPNADHKLLPGQYAFVHLPIPPSSSSMTLPSNALLFRAEGLRVGVIRNGHVELTPVEIGHDYGAKVEIIAGLTPQDEVILNPSDSLAQGQPVEIARGAAQ